MINVLEIRHGQRAQDPEWVQCDKIIVGGSGLRLGWKFIAFFRIDKASFLSGEIDDGARR